MKNFIKMTFATVTGLILFSFVGIFLSIAVIGAVATLGEKQPTMPSSAMMVIDMSTLMLSEQTEEADILTTLQSSGTPVAPLGIYSAINAINKAAIDPAIRFIYIKPDGSTSGVAHLEELRTALVNFRKSGKAIISYMENPTNGGYYLASVSDKGIRVKERVSTRGGLTGGKVGEKKTVIPVIAVSNWEPNHSNNEL